ncbi:putative isocitrate dehydrogenase (NAD(+)) [Helianthus annuus]|nr:putative isocitrate dehydrogenase (NAD(+)) [Helianthus annuus]KAJ0533419.1 putative isocitrate dehydrogenase (NAD(+)) [Helianthus annuus]KAJ0541717.1 putative isocitrate dehydrogenase (NAD(+)) [Helianthus annuus]KAJ0706791.1 putative isocitrate dehydrogenase (NAD(+)) [Helianthus annuus]KAJ0887387.1 putative isocitrate dehydrogenase (NAD(+)) [Helianthus annuus]
MVWSPAPLNRSKNKVCLKGGLVTPVGGGVNSLNVLLRKELDLFVSFVNCFSFLGLVTRHEKVDIVNEVVPGEVESLKVITKFFSERIAKYACEFAHLNDRKTVTAVHKANIMKLADGLFLESCREIAKKYPEITYNEIIVDNCCMQLVSKPEQFDVMVCYCYDFPFLFNSFFINSCVIFVDRVYRHMTSCIHPWLLF